MTLRLDTALLLNYSVNRMGFVKLDCRILDSTLWPDREARELFITALLMAKPHYLETAAKQLKIRSLEETGFTIQPGRYGLIDAAGSGIIRRSGMAMEAGLSALERLGEPEPMTTSAGFEGRRMVRVDGGFIVLNFAKYRDKDHTAAERAKRYRDKKSLPPDGALPPDSPPRRSPPKPKPIKSTPPPKLNGTEQPAEVLNDFAKRVAEQREKISSDSPAQFSNPA